MEEYTQVTLDEWMQWKEDIRRKLAETADNFVYIGYRLKQIRDSGMFGGAADVFGFAQNEYGLGKSTVSRFIAINEKYSEGGNSLELKEEFRGFSSSKLSEMLTLPDNEIQMITEKTTIRAIRELKKFDAGGDGAAQEADAAAGVEGETARTPLEKCAADYLGTRKEMLDGVMKCMGMDPPEYRQAAELMAPSGQAFHKKGIVFLFMYEWDEGIKYKLMTEAEPVHMDWPGFLDLVYGIYKACGAEDVGEDPRGTGQEPEQEPETAPVRPDQEPEPVATSQQEGEGGMEKGLEQAGPEPDQGEQSVQYILVPGQISVSDLPGVMPGTGRETAPDSITGSETDSVIDGECREYRDPDENTEQENAVEPAGEAGERYTDIEIKNAAVFFEMEYTRMTGMQQDTAKRRNYGIALECICKCYGSIVGQG